jgi:hypothetical protein
MPDRNYKQNCFVLALFLKQRHKREQIMEQHVAVLYEGKIAYYRILNGKNASFVARLLRYKGNNIVAPPSEIELCKEGRRWQDDNADQNLVDDIGLAIEQATKPQETAVAESRGSERKQVGDENSKPL